jgi:hypothetical protein
VKRWSAYAYVVEIQWVLIFSALVMIVCCMVMPLVAVPKMARVTPIPQVGRY